MIDFLHYVAFDPATQTLRYEPQNFGQISIFRQIWSYFQRNHLSIKNHSHNNHSQWKLTKKLLVKLKFQEISTIMSLLWRTCLWLMDQNIWLRVMLYSTTYASLEYQQTFARLTLVRLKTPSIGANCVIPRGGSDLYEFFINQNSPRFSPCKTGWKKRGKC